MTLDSVPMSNEKDRDSDHKTIQASQRLPSRVMHNADMPSTSEPVEFSLARTNSFPRPMAHVRRPSESSKSSSTNHHRPPSQPSTVISQQVNIFFNGDRPLSPWDSSENAFVAKMVSRLAQDGGGDKANAMHELIGDSGSQASGSKENTDASQSPTEDDLIFYRAWDTLAFATDKEMESD